MTIKRNSFALIVSILISLLIALPVFAYEEAPMLKSEVEEGNLPPVEERLPEEPLEIEPLHEIGKYGGTWNRISTSETWIFFQMAMNGSNFTRYTDTVGLETAPNLVHDWEFNDDQTIWTFKFRKGLKWSDGEPVTVEDFIFWWEDMALHEEHSAEVPQWAKINNEVMEVTKIDKYTVQFEFADTHPFLIDYLSMWSDLDWSNIIRPSHYLKQFHPDYSDEYDNFEVFEEKQYWAENIEVPVLNPWKPVEMETGNYILFERNPYYYAVDTEGNQLPYIDNVRIDYLTDNEVFKLKMSEGATDMQIRPGVATTNDISFLKNNEEKNNYKTLLWDGGSGTGPLFYPNHNHPEPEKRKIYRNSKFLKALSHAVNRDQIKKMIYYDQGYKTTGTYSMHTPNFTEDEKGEEIFKEWRDSAVEYNPEKSKKLLDEIGVVDENGDGWRQLPNGDELTLRIDTDAEAADSYLQTNELVKETWEEIGLKTIINTVDGSELGVMQTDATFDIRDSWELSDGSSIVGQPEWLIPVEPSRWAPLYGAWYQTVGTSKENKELDKDPRDREPPRKEPEAGETVDRLQKLYEEAKTIADWDERQEIVRKMIKIHIEEGPFLISTVANWPRVGIVSNNFKNVKEELDGGWIQDWHLSYIATLNPEQFYIDE